jgi:hypothetical protein
MFRRISSVLSALEREFWVFFSVPVAPFLSFLYSLERSREAFFPVVENKICELTYRELILTIGRTLILTIGRTLILTIGRTMIFTIGRTLI